MFQLIDAGSKKDAPRVRKRDFCHINDSSHNEAALNLSSASVTIS